MQITLNGEMSVLEDANLTIAALLEKLQLCGKPVAVERNNEVVSYRNYVSELLNDGDIIEIVTLSGGG